MITTSHEQHRYLRQLSQIIRFVLNLTLRARLRRFRFVPDKSMKNLPGGHSAVEPPDPMPNSEVKRGSADGSVAFAMRE